MYHYCIFTCISQDQISVNTSLPSVWRWGPTNRIRFPEETGATSRFFRMGVVVFFFFFFFPFSSISWIFLKIFFLILLRFEDFSTYVSCLRNQLGCVEAVWELASRFRRGEEFLPFLLLCQWCSVQIWNRTRYRALVQNQHTRELIRIETRGRVFATSVDCSKSETEQGTERLCRINTQGIISVRNT